MNNPNLLLIMTDQQRWDAMGCSGGWVETPNMDRIAREGVRFSNCVTNAPLCDSPVEWMDVGPTLVELAGGSLSHAQFGRSLCPVVDDPAREHRSEAISEHRGEVMLLNRQWKAAVNREGQVYLLFDVQNDPDEVQNLAGLPEMADVERDLRLQIFERMIEAQVTAGVRVGR